MTFPNAADCHSLEIRLSGLLEQSQQNYLIELGTSQIALVESTCLNEIGPVFKVFNIHGRFLCAAKQLRYKCSSHYSFVGEKCLHLLVSSKVLQEGNGMNVKKCLNS